MNIDGIWNNAPLWHQYQQLSVNQSWPQALILLGHSFQQVGLLAQKMANLLLCLNEEGSCYRCQSCHLHQIDNHPDCMIISPEGTSKQIRIDQIRTVISSAHQYPQVSPRRVVIINPANQLNLAAANALLKLLEEPPPSLYVILIAPFTHTLPATIISRCQIWTLPMHYLESGDYMDLGALYDENSRKGQVFAKRELIIQDMEQLLTHQLTVCRVAKSWSSCDLSALVWLLSLIFSQLLKNKLLLPAVSWMPFFDKISIYQISQLIESLNAISLKLNHTVSINPTLVLERFLLQLYSTRP